MIAPRHTIGIATGLAFVTLTLASCGVSQSQIGAERVKSCMHNIKPAGAYQFLSGSSVPDVRPAAGGNATSAAALNDCVDRIAVAAGEDPALAAPSTGPGVYTIELGATPNSIVTQYVYQVGGKSSAGQTGQPASTPKSTAPGPASSAGIQRASNLSTPIAGCVKGGGVLQGGGGYCIGY